MKQSRKGFEFLEHASDIYVAAYGETLEEAFENAAKAMFEAMTELQLVEPKMEVEVSAEGGDPQELLYNWLEALLVKYEVEGLLFSRFKVDKIVEREDALRLRASAFGEPLDLGRHPSKVEIKAVTYHMMEVKKEDGWVELRVLFDI
ncbi:archease [Candidatus Hecatella orcuttiae]|uniref:archease n=1 Tax=Candidatus Hecatella orcuttiae TaxID=1935119 RepID=UPI0028683A50|nr:archease [Candidatus Hecatella orcuttiae]